ncbi:hypothetical protein MGI18_15450 [Bacillus sp. OVS6]|nr:hypothetical protein MGI18_15450 [Bacillus sp. OVS6]
MMIEENDMTNINTKIGEHNIRLVCENKKLVNFLTHQFLIRDHGRKIDLSILIEKGYGQPFKNYDVDVSETLTSITFKRADYKITVDPNYTQAEVHVHNELALKHALMNLYSSFIVHRNWGFFYILLASLRQMVHTFSQDILEQENPQQPNSLLPAHYCLTKQQS